MTTIKTYSDLIRLPSFDDRLQYLSLVGSVGVETFGYNRYLNQRFYSSREWREVHDYVVTRDFGCDLAIKDLPIAGKIVVHHMNPLTIEQVRESDRMMLDPEFLVATSDQTHRLIHYGYSSSIPSRSWVPRAPNDTCPWKK